MRWRDQVCVGLIACVAMAFGGRAVAAPPGNLDTDTGSGTLDNQKPKKHAQDKAAAQDTARAAQERRLAAQKAALAARDKALLTRQRLVRHMRVYLSDWAPAGMGVLHVQVQDSSGNPATGAWVSVRWGIAGARGLATGYSNSRGDAYESVGAGSYVVHARKGNERGWAISAPGAGTVLVKMSPGMDFYSHAAYGLGVFAYHHTWYERVHTHVEKERVTVKQS